MARLLSSLLVVAVGLVWASPVAAKPASGDKKAKPKADKDEGLFPPRLTSTAPKPPWPRRRRVGVKVMKGKGQGLIDLKQWPQEPPPPHLGLNVIDERRFGRALKELCANWMPPKRPYRYARWIIEYSRQFDLDPFLLASLIYRQSRCLPRERDNYGMGLAMINPKMHGGFIKRRRYRYWILSKGAWVRQELELPKYAFVSGNLLRARSAIYFAAALLSVNKRQCPANDGAFGSVPHRHFVSHFIWGDRVKGAGAEDRVLRSRRRLIEYYRGELPQPKGKFKGLALRCPLDGVPRKITSGMGMDRQSGKRFHRGVDFASTYYEPVRAVADGRVTLAGLDRPKGAPINVDPEAAKEIKRKEMGPGGLFVMIRHEEGLTSAYMHLASYVVKDGQQVKSGDIIGYVGRTGITESGAHLHFELRHGGRHIDPMPHMEPYVFPPNATYLGRRVAAEQQRVRRRRRVQRWRAYKESLRAKEPGNK